MALQKTDQKPTQPVDETVKLELALYNQYRVGEMTYVKGTVYSFLKEDAVQLLGQQDCGRPVWKLHRVPRVKEPVNMVVDATKTRIPRPVDAVTGEPAKGRIDMGTDDEIADILKSDGDVTV